LDVQSEGARQCAESRCGRVPLPSLDPADLGLVDAGALGELFLCHVLSAALGGKLTSQREVEAERFQLGDGFGAFGPSFGLDLGEEVVKRPPRHGTEYG
jgi:hypothetical protein